jgi:hypothetical protein
VSARTSSGAASTAAPAAGRSEATMNTVTHEQAASELARAYVAAGEMVRIQIAATCEEQGILAALVVLALPEPLRAGFISAMQAPLAES